MNTKVCHVPRKEAGFLRKAGSKLWEIKMAHIEWEIL